MTSLPHERFSSLQTQTHTREGGNRNSSVRVGADVRVGAATFGTAPAGRLKLRRARSLRLH